MTTLRLSAASDRIDMRTRRKKSHKTRVSTIRDDTRLARAKSSKTRLGLSVVTLPALKSRDRLDSNHRSPHRVSSNQRSSRHRQFGTLAAVPALVVGSDQNDYVRGVKISHIPHLTSTRNLLPTIKREIIEIGMGKTDLKGILQLADTAVKTKRVSFNDDVTVEEFKPNSAIRPTREVTDSVLRDEKHLDDTESERDSRHNGESTNDGDVTVDIPESNEEISRVLDTNSRVEVENGSEIETSSTESEVKSEISAETNEQRTSEMENDPCGDKTESVPCIDVSKAELPANHLNLPAITEEGDIKSNEVTDGINDLESAPSKHQPGTNLAEKIRQKTIDRDNVIRKAREEAKANARKAQIAAERATWSYVVRYPRMRVTQPGTGRSSLLNPDLIRAASTSERTNLFPLSRTPPLTLYRPNFGPRHERRTLPPLEPNPLGQSKLASQRSMWEPNISFVNNSRRRRVTVTGSHVTITEIRR